MAAKMFSTKLSTPKPRVAITKASNSSRPTWYPGAPAPEWLDGSLPGDRGFDPMGLSANKDAAKWYRQAELVHARWAMLGVAGILVQEIVHPEIFWYNSGLPENVPGNPLIGNPVNMGGLLAFQFLMMHFVEVLRWQDIRNPGSVDRDPIFSNNKLAAHEVGYPGSIFDPMGFSKGNMAELQTKEIKNGRLAMVAFVGFVFAAQTTGQGPIAALGAHLADPAGQNWTHNIGHCVIPSTSNVNGVTIPLTCLWPGSQ